MRSDIVGAALAAIADGGYAGLTMRGVARSIGASLATVQRHFATKDELWRGAVDTFLDGFEPPALAGSTDSLVRGIEELLGRGSKHPGLITALLSDRAPGYDERFAYIAGRLAHRQAGPLAAIADLQQAGKVRDVDARALLLLLTVGVGAIASASIATDRLYGFDLDDPGDRRRLATALADILDHGLTKR